jgi:protein PhnA
MSDFPPCPECGSAFSYHDGTLLNCPECGHAWNEEETKEEVRADGDTTDDHAVKDVNGKPLAHGDSVIVVKDLPVKGAPKPVKAGTKVKNIRIVSGEHNIACKIDGFGAMGLKSEFVKKA